MRFCDCGTFVPHEQMFPQVHLEGYLYPKTASQISHLYSLNFADLVAFLLTTRSVGRFSAFTETRHSAQEFLVCGTELERLKNASHSFCKLFRSIST